MLAGALALGLLSACATPGASSGVTIAEVQAESNAITAALAAGEAVYEAQPGPSAAELAAVRQIVAEAQAANAALQAATEQASWQGAAESVSRSIEAALSVMPIDPVTRAAIEAGLAVFGAFIAQPVNAPSSGMLSVREHVLGVAAPVHIPMPRPQVRPTR